MKKPTSSNIKFDIIGLNNLADINNFGFEIPKPLPFTKIEIDFINKTLQELKTKTMSFHPFKEKNEVMMSSTLKGGDNTHDIYLENASFKTEIGSFYSSFEISREIFKQYSAFFKSI